LRPGLRASTRGVADARRQRLRDRVVTGRTRRPTRSPPAHTPDVKPSKASRYQLLFERNLAGVLRTHPDGRILDCNEATATIFGCTRAELLAHKAPNLWDNPETRARFVECLQRDGRVTNFETQAIRPDGSLVWLLTSATYFAEGPDAPYIEGTLIDISERKQAEQALRDAVLQSQGAADALRASEQRFRALVENSTDTVALVAPDGILLYVSGSIGKLLGFSVDEVVGRNLLEFAHPDDLSPGSIVLDEILAHPGAAIEVELRARHRDGSWCLLVCVAANHLNEPAVAAIVCNFSDVTIRRHLEQEQAESGRLLRALFENAQDAILVSDDEGRYVEANPAACGLFGVSRNELLGRTPERFYAPGVDYAEAHQAFLADGQSEGVLRLVTAEGEARDVEFSATAHVLPGRHISILRDVTERRRAQDALERSEERFATLFRSSPLAISISEFASGRVIELNARFAELAGRTHEQVLGRTSLELGLWPNAAERDRAIAPLKQGGGVLNLEAHLRRENGELRDVLMSIERIGLAAETEPVLATMLVDVTEHRQLEEQLRQSQKMEAVGRLAGGIAHDFNNILSLILGYGDLLRHQIPEGAPGHKRLLEILKAAERAADLTRQLLAFSRKQVLQPRILDLNAVVSSIDSMLRRMIGEDVTLQTSLAPDLGLVRADPGQLDQVLLNLAVNARDAMPNGGRLSLQTANADLDPSWAAEHEGGRPGPYVMLSMADSGMGMSPEVRLRIFEPFFTTKPAGAGTGLGLATVYGIVRQSEGHIWVYSEPGQGTVFKIYLPRVDSQGEPTPIAASSQERGPLGTETVLVVEDEASLLRLTRELLDDLGYRVLEAPNGAAALELLERHPEPVHLLLSDTVMPGMNGRELAERVRALRPDVRVVLMSGYTDDAILRLGVSRDQVPFLQKPFTPGQLAMTLRLALDAGPPNASNAGP
jgi:two-component system, cell cycle sensor histidine kinase and response regulator CckA